MYHFIRFNRQFLQFFLNKFILKIDIVSPLDSMNILNYFMDVMTSLTVSHPNLVSTLQVNIYFYDLYI